MAESAEEIAMERAKKLSAEEREALVVARDATYTPGVVAAQFRFDNKHVPKGHATARMLDGLCDRGLLEFLHVVGPESIDDIRARGDIERSSSVYYKLTDLGREVARLLEKADV